MNTLSNTATGKAKFLKSFGKSTKRWQEESLPKANEITQSDVNFYGGSSTTVASLLHSGSRSARTRQAIYDQWSQMESDPIVSTALKILVSAALGGHETSGDLVFLESKSDIPKNDKRQYYIDEIRAELVPLFNKTAYTSSYLASAFGDSYVRVHSGKSGGIQDLYIGELVRPTLIQPFERGSRTVGYAISTGEKNFQRLDGLQMARMKMPRTQWIPQVGVIEKSLKYSLEIDDIDDLPLMPSMVGGGFMYAAERPYEALSSSLVGLVGQRWMDSMDEQIYTANLDGMNKDQQKIFIESMVKMLKRSKEIAEAAVKRNKPVMERIRHIMPVFGEKQLTQISSNGSQRSANISIEDIMLHARLLAGSFGVDLSMLGFADQLAGGLGDGGFFRTSAQIGESSRTIRTAQEEFYNSLIDIHTYKKYGFIFDKNSRPFSINFYGSISALEAEKQRTKAETMNGGLILVQAMQQFKEMGATKQMMKHFLCQSMMLDESDAEMYASIVEASNGGGDELI